MINVYSLLECCMVNLQGLEVGLERELVFKVRVQVLLHLFDSIEEAGAPISVRVTHTLHQFHGRV